MSRTIGDAFYRVRPDTAGFAAEATPKIAGAFKKIAAVAGAALASVKVKEFFADAIAGARDLGETATKTKTIFGENTAAVMAFANRAAVAMGQSKQSALEGASTFAIYGQAAKLSGTTLVDFSTRLTTLASDMASFNNTSPEEAIQAIGSALRGESDPIERYGVLLNETVIKNRALQMGLIKTKTAALDPQLRVLAATAEIYAQTTIQQGDFTDNAGQLANQQRILSANWDNLTAKIGGAFLPVLTTLTTSLNTKVLPALNTMWSTHGEQIIAWMQRLAANVGPSIGKLVDKVSSVDWPAVLERAGDVLSDIGPKLASAGRDTTLFSDTIDVAAVVLGFLADNIDLLGKALPYVIGGLLLFKGAQAASNAMSVISIPLRVVELASTWRQNAALRAHTTALLSNTAAQRVNTASTVADNAATNVGLLAKLRSVTAMIAQRVATVATAIATGAWTAVQWLLNIALTANPVGVIIMLIAALIGIIILIATKTTFFQDTWNFVWTAIKAPALAIWNWMKNSLWPGIKRAFDLIGAAITLPAKLAIRKFGELITWFKALPARIGSAFGRLGEILMAPFKFAFNKIAGFWNNGPGKLSFRAPDWVPGIGGKGFSLPQLPTLAHGGLIKARPGGTAAILAEAGTDEIAAPVTLMRQMIAEAVAAAGGNDVHVTLHADHPAVQAFFDLVEVIVQRAMSRTATAIAGGVRG